MIILSRSKVGLQNCLSALTQNCRSWMLNINPKIKPKLWFFIDERKKYDCNFYRGNEKIDIVQNYTYLGTQISSTGNFTLSPGHSGEHLREKAVHALFSLSALGLSADFNFTFMHSHACSNQSCSPQPLSFPPQDWTDVTVKVHLTPKTFFRINNKAYFVE